VEQRTEELSTTNRALRDEVMERAMISHALQEKSKEITDSINYAQRIQRGILSKSEDCYRIFPNSFVLWKPKSTVSGDFYWCYANDDYGYIAVADCTGHGVPGALMSIIANQILDRVVNMYHFTEPKDILFQIDDALITALNQESGTVQDGMDIIICRLDKKNNQLTYAGAMRPLYHFSGETLQEIPANKYAIGGIHQENQFKKFIQHTIQCQPGDSIYLTTDGYQSQFNGTTGKKMMKSRMKQVLENNAKKEMKWQKHELEHYFNQWMGSEEQVDDVLVIGVKF
jgi:serine phosphatase RsbU (regulator of sigma subunit)